MSSHDLSASRPFHPGTPWELFRFESPEVGTQAVAVTAAPAAAADPEAGAAAAAEPSAAATPPEAAPAWGPDDPEFQIAVDQALEQRLAALMGAQQRPQQLPELDPFADNFGQQLVGTFGQLLNHALDERLGPIAQTFESQQVEQGKAESLATFKSFTDLGEFDHEHAFTLAQNIFADYLGAYGQQYAERFTGRALREAAEQQAQYERQIGERAIERYKQELMDASGRGGGEPGVGGGVGRTPESGRTYDDVIANWEARRHAAAVQV